LDRQLIGGNGIFLAVRPVLGLPQQVVAGGSNLKDFYGALLEDCIKTQA